MRSTFTRNSLLGTRRGLTLIELLVTIVIMVAVLAGALPLLSPNNNARKLREASRQLNSLIQQAQAQAARDGRPAGVAFREFDSTRPTGPYSGMALEAYMVAEPPPFAGFSPHSRVMVGEVTTAPGVYGVVTGGNSGKLFKQYNGEKLWQLLFIVGSDPANRDPLPPATFRFGDVIEIDNREFMIVDDEKDQEAPNWVEDIDGVKFLTSLDTVECVWINRKTTDFFSLNTPEMYTIRRLPANTSDAPLQFPRGIGIDMQASHATGVEGPDSFDEGGPDNVRIMFGANGALQGLYFGDTPRERIGQVFLLLGIFENGNNGTQNPEDYDFIANPLDDRDEMAERRSRINWLNPDSQWVTVNRAGRVIASANNTTFNPAHEDFVKQFVDFAAEDQPREQRKAQIMLARGYAAAMQQEGGR
jgi:prepilin-type N-terminal cleavage/methylation domain-containing protein